MEVVRIAEKEEMLVGKKPGKGEMGVGRIEGFDFSVQTTKVVYLWKGDDLVGLPVVSANDVVAPPAWFDRFDEFAPPCGVVFRL